MVAVSTANIGIKNDATLKSSAALTGNYTLNQYIYPGSTTFSSLSPTLSTTSSPITSSWSIGVPVLYVFTIGNSDPTQISLVDVTLKDNALSLASNFVVLNVKCDAINGAVCPNLLTLPQANAPLPWTIPQLMIKGGGSNDIVIRVLGYYTAPNNYQNTFSVFETGNPTTTVVQGPPKNLQITNNWPVIDLGVTKTSSTTSTSFSATSAATIHYKLTFKSNSAEDFYPGSALSIADSLIANDTTPLPIYSIQPASVQISSVSGSTLPAGPVPLTISATLFGSGSNATTYLNWPSGSVIKKGDTITIEFDVKVTTASLCGNSSLKIQNNASIFMNLNSINDSISTNNSALTTPADSFTTGLPTCVAGTIAKKRVCPVSGCPPVNWGDTVTYQIDVQNSLSTAQVFHVRDNVTKQSITVPLRATLAPNSVPADVHCSPSTVVCSTTPATILPQNVLMDMQAYTLFETDFTLQPNGSAGDHVALTFDVRIDKLSNCETDLGNVFINSAHLFRPVTPGSATLSYIAGAQETVALPDLPDLPPCKMKVTKTLVQPTNGITFGQPVSYTITYENLDSQPITVRTLRDYLNMRDTLNSNPYGNVPITNSLAASCTSTTGVSPMPTYQLGLANISPVPIPAFEGHLVIKEAAGGMTFPGNSQLQCTVSFTPLQPLPNNFCKGTGHPEIVNSAFMDISGLNEDVKPSFFAEATAPLPLCHKVSVLKTIPNGVASTGPNGLLTFQIQVTNYSNDPVSNFHLIDPLPSGFTYVVGSLNCTAACTGPGFNVSGDTLTEIFTPIPGTSQSPLNTVTLTFQVHASLAGGTYVNAATGSFGAGPPGTNFYFEGDPAVLLVNSAQVQVLTPTLSKSFQPNSVAVNGSAVLTFTITNQNSDPSQSGISFTDQLPSGVTVTSSPSAACGGVVSISGGNAITLTGGGLLQGHHTCQFSVDIKASSCGAFVNDPSHFPPTLVTNLDVTNAKDTLTVTGCLPGGTPTLAKQFAAATIGPNGTTTLGFTITNSTGDPKQSGISFSDTLPVGLQFVGIPTSDCGGVSISPDGRTIILTGGSLLGPNSDGSGKHACHITVTVKATDVCGVYQNNKTNFSSVNHLDISNINQQLEVVGCKQSALCAVKTDQISCKASGSGGYLYTFTVTNNTGKTVTDVLLTPLVGSSLSITPQQPQLPAGGLANGASLTLQTTINGGQTKQSACFNVTLMTKDGECCTVQVCPVLPDCCATIDGKFKCDAKGSYTGSFVITNTSSNIVKNIYLYPPPGVTMSQTYFAVTLAPGQSFTTPAITISGAKPGKVCFRVSLHTEDMKQCCVMEQCIVLPDCGIQVTSFSPMLLLTTDAACFE
jgi:uncharacterized repeat protein (TIGR01451 family)